MDPALRIITQFPLAELWNESGPVTAREVCDLSAAAIADLLRGGPVRFVIADIGHKPVWVPQSENFRFWKEEVKPHLAEPGKRVFREEFPGEFFYFASEWRDGEGNPIIVLTRCH